MSINSQYAAIAACLYNAAMENKFYNRATGKSTKGTNKSFGEQHYKSWDSSTVYTLDDDESITLKQYPMGTLSVTQKKYIESFLQGISLNNLVYIDIEDRAIHWIGFWMSDNGRTIISCSLVQPNISNATVHLRNIKEKTVIDHASIYFPSTDRGSPSIRTPGTNPQIQGKFAIPLADSLIQSGKLQSHDASWSNIVLVETEPIFIVSNADGTYECKLTHTSCEIIKGVKPDNVGIISPTSNSQNMAFRSKASSGGGGTGPAITIHRFGTLQYQGKPESAYTVGRCFKECIYAVMSSKVVSSFVNSLAVVGTANRDS